MADAQTDNRCRSTFTDLGFDDPVSGNDLQTFAKKKIVHQLTSALK